MNCHGNHNDNKGNKHKSHLSHMLMMILCCGAPILLLRLVPVLANSGSVKMAAVLSTVAPFICPLMMLLMIPMMFKKNKGSTE